MGGTEGDDRDVGREKVYRLLPGQGAGRGTPDTSVKGSTRSSPGLAVNTSPNGSGVTRRRSHPRSRLQRDNASTDSGELK